ncbi:MAG: diguanylate cyclase [Moraxellaceae bacterium]|nr:diguanylate cyclase [Moraxellaceae bacterium]
MIEEAKEKISDYLRLAVAQIARVLSGQSVSRQRGAEQQLHLFRHGLDSARNGIVICDALEKDMPIVFANSAFERMTGYAPAEVLGRNCRFLQRDDGDQPGLAELRDSLRRQDGVTVVLRNYRRDGSLIWNELSISPIRNERGLVSHYVGVLNDVTEQKRCETELNHNFHHDRLTGLPNRSLLEERLAAACTAARTRGGRLAVLFVDLDGFKPINDSMGHKVGDELLVEVARRMTGQVRSGDTVARMGGDEFIVLLAGPGRQEDALCVAERVLQALALPYEIGHNELHLTASIGIATSDGCLDDPAKLLQQADLAMYRAKQQGRNNFQCYTSNLDEETRQRLELRNDLRRAIEQDALELYYQPQIDGRSGRVVAIEALLRWNHPERGFIPPAELVQAAEDAGQIGPLSAWVLHAACAFNNRLLKEGQANVAVAVNISGALFRMDNLLGMVRAALERSTLPAALLELEITESVFLGNAEGAIATLQALRELGVKVVLDDFGTGLSSLNNLKRLPINKVKVDRSFIKTIISDRHDAAVMQGIISLAHHLQLQVVAEGVETEAQYHFLKKIQCDCFQGYFLAYPMPYEDLELFLRKPRELGSPVGEESGGKPPTLLLLDDEENILRALTRVLRRDRYEILVATNAHAALEILAMNEVQVIISDQRMPEMSGTEFLSRVKDLYPDTVRIVLSGYTDLKTITDAINQGEVYKFLLKPWDDDNLRSVVAQAFRQAAQVQNAGGGA